MSKKEEIVLGVLGGMGTYATIHIFQQFADVFPAKKEWERPRIVLDNNCRMPSRVRAYLEGVDREKLISEMTKSIDGLIHSGCNRIIIGCNTAHIFLPEIYDRIPEAKGIIINIIENCVKEISKENVEQVFLLASEGTIESQVYQKAFKREGILCDVPTENDYGLLRKCIEAVKQKSISEDIIKTYLLLANKYKYCVLGCTEFPILQEIVCERISTKIYDPILIALKKLYKEFRQNA